MERYYLISLVTREGTPYYHQLYNDRENAITLVWSMVEETLDKAQVMVSDMEEPESLKELKDIETMLNWIIDSDGNLSVIIFTNNETDMIIELTPLIIH